MKQINIKNLSNQLHCPKCGNDNFHRCHRLNKFENLISRLGLFPYICYHHTCRERRLIFSSTEYFKYYDKKTFVLTIATFSLVGLSFFAFRESLKLNSLTRLLSSASYLNEYIDINTDKLLEYQNIEQGIQIKYPEDWEKQELPDPLTGEIVTFVSPQESDFDTDREKLVVNVEVLSNKNTSLKEYINSSYTEIQTFLKNSMILESSITTLGDIPAYKLIYTGKDSRSNWIANMEIITVKNNKAYIITYTTDSSNYTKFLRNAEEMINNFKFLQ